MQQNLLFGAVAQLGERLSCKQGSGVRASPVPPLRDIAQLEERTTDNREVEGSTPPVPTSQFFDNLIVGRFRFDGVLRVQDSQVDDRLKAYQTIK